MWWESWGGNFSTSQVFRLEGQPQIAVQRNYTQEASSTHGEDLDGAMGQFSVVSGGHEPVASWGRVQMYFAHEKAVHSCGQAVTSCIFQEALHKVYHVTSFS